MQFFGENKFKVFQKDKFYANHLSFVQFFKAVTTKIV